MSASNVMTRARTAAYAKETLERKQLLALTLARTTGALQLCDVNAELRVEEAHLALRLEDPLAAQCHENVRGPGSFHEYRLEMARRPILQKLDGEDAAQLLDYEANGPRTRDAEDQAVFHRVVWEVALEFGYEDDIALYLCKRDLRLTLLDAFQAVDQRLKDKKI